MMKEEWVNRRKEAARRMQTSLRTLFDAAIGHELVKDLVEVKGIFYPKKATSAASILSSLCQEFYAEVLWYHETKKMLHGRDFTEFFDFSKPFVTSLNGCLIVTFGSFFSQESNSQCVFLFSESQIDQTIRRSLKVNPNSVVFEIYGTDRGSSTIDEHDFELFKLEDGTVSFCLPTSMFCNSVMKRAFTQGLHTLNRMFSPVEVSGKMARRVVIAATKMQRRRVPFGPLTKHEHARREMKTHVDELLEMYPPEALTDRTELFLKHSLCSKKLLSQFGSLKQIIDSVHITRVFRMTKPDSQKTSFNHYKHETELPLYRAFSKTTEPTSHRRVLNQPKSNQLMAHPLIHPILSEGMTEHLIVGFVITSRNDSVPPFFVERGDYIPYTNDEQAYLDNITARAELPLATEGLALYTLGLAHVVHRSQVSEVLSIAEVHGWYMFNEVLRHLYSWQLDEHILDVDFALSFLDGTDALKEHYPVVGKRREAFEQSWV
jgi:hypothetical protein